MIRARGAQQRLSAITIGTHWAGADEIMHIMGSVWLTTLGYRGAGFAGCYRCWFRAHL